MRNEVERIVWIDSGMFIDKGWATTQVYRDSIAGWRGDVESVGTVMFEDDDVVVLGLSRDIVNDTWYGAQLIHKPCISYREALGAPIE